MKRFAVILACCLALAIPATPAFAKARTTIVASISKSTCTYGSPASFTATLTTSAGRPLANKTLVLRRNGTKIGSYKTNSKGVVTRKVKYLGTASWKYSFAGDRKYKAAKSGAKTTTAIIGAAGTFYGVPLSDGSYDAHPTISIEATGTYQIVANHAGAYDFSLGATLIAKSTSGKRSQFNFKGVPSTEYELNWLWGGPVNGVTSTKVHLTLW